MRHAPPSPVHDPEHLPSVTLGGQTWRPDASVVLPDYAVAAVRAGRQPAERGLRLTEANRLLEPGHLPMENGYARLDDGMLHVAVLTPMPGVTGDMLDWWFAWHGEDQARYVLWHPKDHVWAAWRKPVVWSQRWREVYVSNVSDVDEFIGSFLQRLSIDFQPPERYVDASRFATTRVETAVCARTVLRERGLAAGHVVHLVRSTDAGIEMRSRFWLGDLDASSWGFVGRALQPLLDTGALRRRAVPDHVGRDLLIHCAEEMLHLAGILPELFSRFAR